MQKSTLNVNNRIISNKGSLKRIRQEGLIPANIYGKSGAKAISLSSVAFRNLNKELSGTASLIELEDEKGDKSLTLIQSIQVNPITRVVDHIDFKEVSKGESFTASIPVSLTGVADCIGVKNDGGVINHKTHEVEVKCIPSKLPEKITVDVSNLNVGEAIHIQDLEKLDGVVFLGNGIQVIVSCQPPTVATIPQEELSEEDPTNVPVIEKENKEEETASGDNNQDESSD